MYKVYIYFKAYTPFPISNNNNKRNNITQNNNTNNNKANEWMWVR
jgi:hypothetical protein